MCNFERHLFRCRHFYTVKRGWCHHARHDSNHICFGVQIMKGAFSYPNEDWPDCVRGYTTPEQLEERRQFEVADSQWWEQAKQQNVPDHQKPEVYWQLAGIRWTPGPYLP